MINNGFYIDYVYINLLIFIVTVVIVSICILFIIASVNIRNIDILFGRVQSLQISKQDDTSAHITGDEWLELAKSYGFDTSVKPDIPLTRDTAIRLLQYLKK